jgi:hypothetical protein
MASEGNAEDFGDLTSGMLKTGFDGACGSSVRGIMAGGGNQPSAANVMHYVTISTTGNSMDFGDSTISTVNGRSACSNPTRGVIGGGVTPSQSNVIDYITIASTGNAQDFGDLTGTFNYGMAGASSTRGIFSSFNPSYVSDTVNIASTGNGVSFGGAGVMAAVLFDGQIASNGHGGL